MMNEKIQNRIINKMIITIDGPAGSGKSTTASLLAERLNLTYLDTGAMYRAVTYAVLENGVDPENNEGVAEIVEGIDLEFGEFEDKKVILLNGKKIEKEIRDSKVSNSVSKISRLGCVRREMVKLQRKIAKDGGIVAEGRDLGTVVFPYAHFKIFLVAGIEARVTRRVAQLKSMGLDFDPEKVRENILKRDSIDSSREISPLVKSPGALVVDTSGITIREQVAMVENHALKRAEYLEKIGFESDKEYPLRGKFYYRFTVLLVRLIYRFIFGLKIYGKENLKFKGPVIFASNHSSLSDPPIVATSLKRKVWILAKKELFENPVFSALIRKYHSVPINRNSFDRKALSTLINKLKEKESILMFPQGTRSKVDKIEELKVGIGFIAMRARANIIPVYLRGSNHLLRAMLRLEKLQLKIGPPILINNSYGSDDRKRDYRIISSMIIEEMRMLEGE
ncbi:MAG TPA: (d)CMP kinase [Candidatus Krumholzibacteriaceae bacterium]|nr:(d)CMP kinase [Candidatus Krumholzibacteriaceae bacterium]